MDARRPLAVVTPTLDGNVLSVLALADASFTTGQLHRMLPDHSENGIRNVLIRLAEQGIVMAERAGNAYLYRFNRDHLAAEPIIELVNMRARLLVRIEERLNTWKWQPVYAAVFGSMARGVATTGSDVDLLLVRPDEAPEDDWASQVVELSEAVTRWTGNDARPIEFGVEELKSRRKEPLFKDISAQGLTVGGDREWFRLLVGGR